MFKFIRRALSLILTLTIALSLTVITPLTARAAMPTAYPSTTTFVMNGQTVSVPEAYSINGSNYLQLRGIAALLKGTTAQFNVYWDRAIIIEPGRPYTGTTTPTKLAKTTDVRYNRDASFKIDGFNEYDRLQDAYYIDGDTNYVQLRYFAGLLNGTASQFNVYWDSTKGQAIIEPGAYYTGVDSNYVGTAPSIDMVHVPAGAYAIYGTKVTLTKGYHVGTYEVTQEQYQAVMGKNPSYFDGSDDNWVGNVLTQMPDGSYIYMFDLVKSSDGAPKGTIPGEVQARRAVDSVSWYDALVFCNKLSMLSKLTPVYSINGSTNPKDWGIVPTSNNDTWNAVTANWDANGYRLPTSAEWYIASRAGTDKLFFGKDEDIDSFDLLVKMRDDYAWYVHNSSVPLSNTELGYTHEVGKRLPNPWGLYDMYGNVNEWCWDFDSNNFPVGVVDPVGPTADVASNISRRTYSGGSCHTDNTTLGVRNRGSVVYHRNEYTGLRLVRNDDSPRIAAPENATGNAWGGYLLKQIPNKTMYSVGDGFDTTGIVVHHQANTGIVSVVDNSKLKFYTSGTVELTQGRKFTTEGVKVVEVQCDGKKVDTFEIRVMSESVGDLVEDGDYYMQIYGKYLYPVYASGTLWLELSDKKPDKPYTIKLINYSKDRGPEYTIQYDGAYICQPSSTSGDQLQSNPLNPHRWRINQYSSFCTIRDYGKQSLLVVASKGNSNNGTKILVGTYTGSAPDSGKINMIKAN